MTPTGTSATMDQATTCQTQPDFEASQEGLQVRAKPANVSWLAVPLHPTRGTPSRFETGDTDKRPIALYQG